jgi:AraC-like DNA-binding protein
LLGYEAGADAYLAKPIRQEVLLQILHNFILNTQLIKQRIHLASELNWDDVTSNNSDIQFMTEITQFVEDNLTNQTLDAEQIITHTALSRTVLYAKMKAITGLGVHEFIRTLRLKRSIKLLLEGELNVSQIAYEVGFNSPSYYVRSFTKQYGNSPKEYLKKLLLDK